MKKHVTFAIDDDLDRKVREHQVRMMLELNETYSFSDTINDLLARGA